MGDGPITRGKRLAKLAGMTASVVTRYAAAGLKGVFLSDADAELERRRAHLHSGGRIARTLGELKGAVMKVGQMVSIASDVLPPELANPLRALQREAPPMPFEAIAEQVRQELGAAPERLFARFDPVPFAAASIGQVHRAQLDDGREVVCKVQYPGIGDAVDSDLRSLKLALRAGVFTHVKRSALDAVFVELRSRLHEELDYCLEADSVRLFREYHRLRHPFVVIPDVVGERSSQRVLTLGFQPGDTLATLTERGYTAEERDRLGEHLVTLIASQIFEFGAFHADPHPGNFAFRRDGTIVIYDFGCTKTLPREIVCACHGLLVAGLAGDFAGVEEALLRLGVRDSRGPPVEADFYRHWQGLVVEGVLKPGRVDWGESRGFRRRVAAELPALAGRMRSFQPAKHLVLLNRVLAGHYGNLRALGPRIDVRGILEPLLSGFDAGNLRATAVADTATARSAAVGHRGANPGASRPRWRRPGR